MLKNFPFFAVQLPALAMETFFLLKYNNIRKKAEAWNFYLKKFKETPAHHCS